MTEAIDIITSPTVRLVGRLAIDKDALDGFLSDEGVETWTTDTDIGSQALVECAGRLCYKSYAKPRPGGNAAYLGHILDVGHGSVIEHAVFNFIITGVSRSFTHELVRHRAGWAYSQRSQRFVDEATASFVVPPLYREAYRAHLYRQFVTYHENASYLPDEVSTEADALWPELANTPFDEFHALADIGELWIETVTECQSAYAKLADVSDKLLQATIQDKTLRRKQAREAARSVLPNATETQIFVTANARALRHFLEARGIPEADAEIRAVALAMLGILSVEAPNLFGDYRIETTDGIDYITTAHPKV